MSFISWQYALLLAGVFLAYWKLPWRGRIWLLLVASYIFYACWDGRFIALLLTSTIIDFYCGLAIVGERRPASHVVPVALAPFFWLGGYSLFHDQGAQVERWILASAGAFPVLFALLYQLLWRLPVGRQRKAFLLLSILTNLVVLGFFKYFNFFADSALALAGHLGWSPGWVLPNVLLPVAVSFYTFQSISYSTDIYRGKARPARDPVVFAAYLSFFPQLVAGPIERPNDLLPQFERPAAWNTESFHRGLRLILTGLFKKVFVGDNCALVASYAFSPAVPLDAPWAVLGATAFAFQIYGDFSGYTDIARGSARLLGIHLNHNFNFPYFAVNPSDFWRRWHITLSSWFRDYVYIPLGGNRGSASRTAFNLWFTMLLAGLWHGANWTFIIWGAYHGALLILYRIVPGLEQFTRSSGWRAVASMLLMFSFTLIGWAIFRCATFGDFARWLAALGQWQAVGTIPWWRPAVWVACHALPLLALQAGTWKARDEVEMSAWPWPLRGLAYAAMFLAVATSSAGSVAFIYFQF
jgi:D-alanyl-lipoteichoic acid acyltransferase DltB (MBOAT superfamily)